MSTKQQAIKELKQIPGVGVSIAADLWDIGITSIKDLRKIRP
jgi:predicted flap endonuclease-1-like 5' DNA nuclease